MKEPFSKRKDDKTPTEIAAEYFEQGYTPEEVKKIMLEEHIHFPSISGILNELLGKKNMSVESLANLSGMNPGTIYRFMNNERNPSRNALLRIAITLQISFSETQVLLKAGNCSALSASRPRDMIIMDGIINKKFFIDINDELIRQNMVGLNSRG